MTAWDGIAKSAQARIKYPRTPDHVEHLSHSSIATYLRCPRQWAYSYLEGLRRPPGVALIKGSAVDRAASYNFQQKIASYTDLPTRDVQEVAEDAFRRDVDQNGGQKEIDWNGANFARSLDSAISLTELHMTRHAPLIQPAEVQLELHRKLQDGREFVGFVDVVDSAGVFHDVKTGSKKMGQSAADTDQQPTAYAFLNAKPIVFAFDRVIDTGTRLSDEVVETSRDQRAIDWFDTAASEISVAINLGVFPPRTDGWHCAERFCGYWTRCMVEHRLPQIG